MLFYYILILYVEIAKKSNHAIPLKLGYINFTKLSVKNNIFAINTY